MAIKLHRCSGTFIKGGHPCWKAEKALNEAGIEYEAVHHPAFPRSRRAEVERLSGQRKLPFIEFEDGTFLHGSSEIAARAKAGTLLPAPAAADSSS
jgi:glutathione S-transferase